MNLNNIKAREMYIREKLLLTLPLLIQTDKWSKFYIPDVPV